MSISDQEVEAAHQVIWPATEWNDGEHACRGIVRLALTAAANARKSEGVDESLVIAFWNEICGVDAWEEAFPIISRYLSPLPVVSSPVGVTEEMVLAGCRVLHPSLFSRGINPLPQDGPATQGIIAEDVRKVRAILAAALNPTIGG